jgi:DNA-binding SARP family transcriptional activator
MHALRLPVTVSVRAQALVPVLTLQAFGFPALRLGDEHLAFSRRKTGALLLYLAITRRVHARDTLAYLLWGEMTQERAMANLRKSLGEVRERVGATVTIGFHTVAINPDYPIELDVAAFAAAVARGIATEDVPLLTQAVARYPADFLAGFHVPLAEEFDAWASLYREHLREQLLAALESLATLHSARGAYRAALGPARRVVALDPWREAGQRQLMQVLAATGDRAAAVAQYAVCRQTLAEELGIEPGAETVALYEQLRAGTDAADMSDSSPAAMTGHERKDESVHPPAHARPPACRRGRSLLRASAHPGMVAGRERPGSRGHRAPCHGHASSEDGSAPAISILLAQSQDA